MSTAAMSRQARRRRIKRLRRRVGQVLMPHVAPTFLSALSSTWKTERLDPEHIEEAERHEGSLTTLWHGRMILPLPIHANRGYHVLVSPSDDGNLVKPLLTRFGYGVIRGSSNKNPARALREMVDRLRVGGRVVITPDGPRGPRHSTNPGTAWMAKATGFPILPCGFATDRAWRLNSWDAFTIPKPWARVVIVYGEPFLVDSDADDEAIESATNEMARRMHAAERKAFEHLGLEPDW